MKAHCWDYSKMPRNMNRGEYRKYKVKSMLNSQEERCKTCDVKFSETVKYYIDHCHKEHFIRGLLCLHCNVALGHVKDNVDTLQRMITYLNGEMWPMGSDFY